MDKGWWFDEEASRWQLLGAGGLPVRGGAVPAALVERADRLAELNRYGAARFWPELTPGSPPWRAVLAGGRMDGQHEYLPRCDYPAGPPDLLTLAWSEPAEVLAGPGEGPQLAAEVNMVQVYVRAAWCGHDGCPVPYLAAR